jgi:hypothetical protein
MMMYVYKAVRYWHNTDRVGNESSRAKMGKAHIQLISLKSWAGSTC